MTHSKKLLTIATAAGGALLAASAAPALGTPHVQAHRIATPKLAVTITFSGGQNQTSDMVVSGPKKVSAGRVNLSLHSVGGDGAVDIVRVKPGHTFKEVAANFAAFGASFGPTGPSAAGLRALRKSVHSIVFYGGLDTGTIGREHGSVVLPKAGHYLLINDSGGGPNGQFRKLTVTAKVGSRATPKSSATVTAVNAKRFRGATTLPAAGTITFKNKATNSPHFLVLQHVKQGTTRQQVITAVSSNSSGPPPFALPESAATDVVGEGHAMTVHYKLPAGEYAEMCFFPDLQTGMPHAMMGMVRIVHLK
jgi:hypothetical protein